MVSVLSVLSNLYISLVSHVMNKRNKVAFDTAPQSRFCLRLENEKRFCQVDSATPKFLKHSQKDTQNCQWNQAFQQAKDLASNAKYLQVSKGCRFCGVQQHDQCLFSPKMK